MADKHIRIKEDGYGTAMSAHPDAADPSLWSCLKCRTPSIPAEGKDAEVCLANFPIIADHHRGVVAPGVNASNVQRFPELCYALAIFFSDIENPKEWWWDEVKNTTNNTVLVCQPLIKNQTLLHCDSEHAKTLGAPAYHYWTQKEDSCTSRKIPVMHIAVDRRYRTYEIVEDGYCCDTELCIEYCGGSTELEQNTYVERELEYSIALESNYCYRFCNGSGWAAEAFYPFSDWLACSARNSGHWDESAIYGEGNGENTYGYLTLAQKALPVGLTDGCNSQVGVPIPDWGGCLRAPYLLLCGGVPFAKIRDLMEKTWGTRWNGYNAYEELSPYIKNLEMPGVYRDADGEIRKVVTGEFRLEVTGLDEESDLANRMNEVRSDEYCIISVEDYNNLPTTSQFYQYKQKKRIYYYETSGTGASGGDQKDDLVVYIRIFESGTPSPWGGTPGLKTVEFNAPGYTVSYNGQQEGNFVDNIQQDPDGKVSVTVNVGYAIASKVKVIPLTLTPVSSARTVEKPGWECLEWTPFDPGKGQTYWEAVPPKYV